LALDPLSLAVTHVSANAAQLFGLAPTEILGAQIGALVSPDYAAALAAFGMAKGIAAGPAGHVALTAGGDRRRGWRAASHRAAGGLIVEIAPLQETGPDLEGFLVDSALALRGVGAGAGYEAEAVLIARRLREIAAYDRVAVIRWEGEGPARVIAESKAASVRPSLIVDRGIATELCAVARMEAHTTAVRMLLDIAAEPVALLADPRRAAGAMPDLSGAILRAPTPEHIRLLSQIGARSALFVALGGGGQPWGALAFIHNSPHRISLPYRTTLQLIAESIAMRFVSVEAIDRERKLAHRRISLATLRQRLARDHSGSALSVLRRHGEELLRVVGANGAWCHLPEGDLELGRCPDAEAARRIAAVCRTRATDAVFATDDLPGLDPSLAAHAGTAGRALFAPLPRSRGVLLLLRGRPSSAEHAPTREDSPWSPVDLEIARDVAGVADELQPRFAERHNLRRALENEAKLRAILDATQDGLIVIDSAGTILDFSPSAERLLGWSRAELLGRHVAALVSEPLNPAHLRPPALSARDQGPRVLGSDGGLRARRKDGSTFPLELTLTSIVLGGSTQFIGAMRDISERLDGEQRDRFWFEHSSVGYAVSEISGRRIRVNPALGAILGYTAAELLERGCDSTCHPEDATNARAWRDRVRAGDDSPYRAIERFQHKDGKQVWGRVTASPMRLSNSADALIVSELVDITDLMEADATRKAALARAETASAAKTQFLATMSHELRTPLNAIIGLSEMMAAQVMGPVGNPRYAEYVRDIAKAGRHLLDLVTDVLDTSKIEAGGYRLAPVDLSLAEVVEETHRILIPLAEQRGVKLKQELPPGLPRVHADPRALRQVLINVISNAVKFTPAGGFVTIGASPVPRGIEIVVTDTGQGIAAADLPHVVEPFYRASDAYTTAAGGAGLGLAIANGLVEAHGGVLSIASDIGRGTTVTLRFPAAAPA
jgi:PAS domain S-box-containing protein